MNEWSDFEATQERIRSSLGLPSSRLGAIGTQMRLAYRTANCTIPTIYRLLTRLEALRQTRSEMATDGNSTLIKAGPLQWNPGSQLLAVSDEYAALQQELKAALDMQTTPTNSYSGSLRRS